MSADRGADVGGTRIWYPRVASTMDVAMRLATAGAPHGTLVEAAEQTAGRGRLGRRWEAPDGSAFLGSWLLRAPLEVDLAGLSPAVAAAVLRAVEAIAPGVPAQLKWPNDVLIDGRKVAGILITTRMGATGAVVIAGTGINVARESARAGVNAASLSEWAPAAVVADVRDRLAAELGAVWAAFAGAGGLPERERRWLEGRMAWRGDPVRVVLPQVTIEGVPVGLAPDGGLRLRPTDGATERVLHVGEIVRGPRPADRAGAESTVYLPEHDCC